MAARTRRQIGPRYERPRDVRELDSSAVGFTNGFYLRVPRLHYAGDLTLLKQPMVAIVGSREASEEGRLRAAQLAKKLVQDGIVVVSGLAAGIDAAAHRAAIANGGRTVAVIGTPLEKAYPAENAALQEEVYRDHLLISPFAPGMRTFPSHFPERNRVMARLALATVIIEAGDTSGSLHQAAESLDAGRHLFIAKSVVQNERLNWPARFIGRPRVHELESSTDVADILLR
jgi:DNA processing protein